MEKRLIREFIYAYRNFPCLWDTHDTDYGNRVARQKAYESLLGTYKATIDKDGNTDSMKKKIEHLRTAYKRQYKKAVESGFRHKPVLWYYNDMLFLDGAEQGDGTDVEGAEDETSVYFDEEAITKEEEISDNDESTQYLALSPSPASATNTATTARNTNTSDIQAIYFTPYVTTTTTAKKPKLHKANISTTTTRKRFEPGEPETETTSYEENNSHLENTNNQQNVLDEVNSFGTTVALQLQGVDKMQRIMAQKLISDVIYHARLHQLSTKTSLTNLNEATLDEMPSFHPSTLKRILESNRDP